MRILRKIKNKIGLNLCLLAGLMLMVAVFSCHPLLLRGGESSLLSKLFDDYITENEEYPSLLSRRWAIPRTAETTAEDVQLAMDVYRDKWNEYIDIDIYAQQYLYRFDFSRATSDITGSGFSLELWGGNELTKHITETSGSICDDILTEDGESIYPCYISEKTANERRIFVGDRLTYKQVTDKEQKPLRVYVAAVYRNVSDTDAFWQNEECSDSGAVVIDDVFSAISERFISIDKIYCYESIVMDYTHITPENADRFRKIINQFHNVDSQFETPLGGILYTYRREAISTEMILFALELPCIILMLLFIYMVVSRILGSEESDIAVWRSRGFTRLQILFMYIRQIIAVSIPAYGLGILLGYGLCLLGAGTDSFMHFTSKDTGNYMLIPQAFVYGGIAIVVALAFMLPPIWRSSKLTIVDVKRNNKYSGKKSIADKLFIDVMLLILSLYLLYNFDKQKESIVAGILAGKTQDPIVFLNASLFIFACGLLTLRLSGYVISLFYRLFRKHFGAVIYAACLQTKRTQHTSGILAVFLVMTIAGGVYAASLAGAINKANEERCEYGTGADMRTAEKWKTHIYVEDEKRFVEYTEPDYMRYDVALQSELITDRTKVIIDKNVTADKKKTVCKDCVYMGIVTDEFGRIARLKDGLNDEHWYNALNALATETEGVIISQNLADNLGVGTGDEITYTRYLDDKDREGTLTIGTVVAVVNAFPGFERYSYAESGEGGLTETEHYLIVGNYAYAVSEFAPYPYEVWYSLQNSACDYADIASVLEESGIHPYKLLLMNREILRAQTDAIVQIINGVLTISFIISCIITIAGLMIFWVVSIKSRELLFGIFRAMGMHMGEIGGLMFMEIFMTSFIPAGAALGIGCITAEIFSKMPVYVCLPRKSVIPLEIGLNSSWLQSFLIGILIMIILCIIAVRGMIRRMNIANALKLGED